jgi:uncharacterized protein YbjT (DUF2867 family)
MYDEFHHETHLEVSPMSEGTVLVTGAAGGAQGSTGKQVVGMLLERGVDVRAFVRRDDERAEALRGLGAEVVVGDLRDIASVRPALRGVRRAFFTYPVDDGLLDATAAFAAAAREYGVEQVVNVSQLAPSPEAPTPRMRQHWVGEQLLDWAGVGAVHLRATVFYENLRALVTRMTDGSAGLAVPLGTEDTVIPLVGAVDVARVAAGVLAGPQAHPPGFVPLVGQVATVKEFVATFGRVVGTPLHYADISSEAWHSAALTNGYNAHAVEHLTSLWAVFRDADPEQAAAAYQVSDAIERVGGSGPQTLEAFFQGES